MSYKATGRIIEIGEREHKTDKFTMRIFVIETADQYPQPIKFQLVNDRCDLADKLKVGQDVTVHFDIRGNRYQDKVFNNLNAWKIDLVDGHGQERELTPTGQEVPMPDLADEDGLPF